MRLTSHLICYFFAVLAMGLAGCGASHPAGLELHGKVTLDDRPLENATIKFHPRQELNVLAQTRVVKGEFTISAQEGVPGGEYDVTVIPSEPEFEEIENARRNGEIPPLQRVMIPQVYQQPGKLTASVSEEGSREFTFALTTRPQP